MTLVDKLVSSMKKIFLKAPDRVSSFHEMYPGVPLPPKPIITRWGTWLNAASYYADHLNEIAAFVVTLEENDCSAIKEVQKLLSKKKEKITMEIVEIRQYYCGIAETITKLETKGLSLVEAAELWEDAIMYLSATPHQIIATKIESINSKNPDLPVMLKLAKNDASVLGLHPFNEMSPADMARFRFAPLVSVDVERSFSMFKNVLRDNRRSFLVENLKQHLVIMFYSKN